MYSTYYITRKLDETQTRAEQKCFQSSKPQQPQQPQRPQMAESTATDTPTKPARYKTGVLVDLNAVADSVKSASAVGARYGASWLESLLSSVEAWRASAPVLGPYVIEDVVLGEGGYGRVVRGRDTTNGETVAIKEALGAAIS